LSYLFRTHLVITMVWENPLSHTAGKIVIEYLTELQSNLKQIRDLAHQNSAQEQQRCTSQYNKRAVYKDFEIMQQVVVLFPDSTKKLLSRWQGPDTQGARVV